MLGWFGAQRSDNIYDKQGRRVSFKPLLVLILFIFAASIIPINGSLGHDFFILFYLLYLFTLSLFCKLRGFLHREREGEGESLMLLNKEI